MNGLSQRNKTLGEMMTDLRTRLGFASQGSAAHGNDAIMKSFLQEAHEYVYGELEPPAMRKKATIELARGSYLYDWHNDQEDEDIDPGRVLSVWLKVGDTDPRELRQGITEGMRGVAGEEGEPTRYDTLNGQIELYPVPNQAMALVLEYTAERGRFERPSDRPSAPDRLVFLYALAMAKAHYQRADADAVASSFKNMLSKEKVRQRGSTRYFVNQQPSSDAGQVVRSADGSYTLQVH